MNRFSRFLGRIFRGEDVILVKQSREHWNAQFVDGKWDRLVSGQQNTELLAKLLLEQRRDGATLRVLDVGCGNGGLARLIAGESGVAYTGIDISKTALVVAQKIAPLGQFIVADAEQPPSDIGTFDAFVFNEVFFYMNPDRALPCYRAHAAGGARIFTSVIRSWRTPFIFHRMRRHLRIDTRFRVVDRPFRWDVAVGHFV